MLLTRFNLRVQGLRNDKAGRPVLGPEWMRERLDLFEKYCVPSVRHQTVRDFTWLIFLDRDTEPADVERLRSNLTGVADARLILLPPVTGSEPVAKAALECVEGKPDVLLTTRLDNDDALHAEALATVRGRVRPDRMEFLNLRFGYVTDGRHAWVKSHKYGHFTTLVEPAASAPFHTVYCGLPHGRARRLAPFRQIADRPYWLEVIHGRNAANRGPGERRTYDFRRPKGWQRWLRFEVVRPLRKRFWPAHYRVRHRLEDVAGPFHVKD